MDVVITGITGQDGSFLAEKYLAEGHNVHGMVRRTSEIKRTRLDKLRKEKSDNLALFYGDLSDLSQLRREITRLQPDLIFHLAGQSHVGISFEIPETTMQEVANATLGLLELCRDLSPRSRILLVGSSEVYGNPAEIPQNETTPHSPTSPYGCAKSCALQFGRVYREAFDLGVSSVIPYNHESVRRGENFVTRKITRTAAQISLGHPEVLELGNLDGARDWGYAPEYADGMSRIIEAENADDFVLATGVSTTVREFAQAAFETAGKPIQFEGEGVAEVGKDLNSGEILLRVNKRFFRPADPLCLIGDASKAKDMLGWSPKTIGVEVARVMVESELDLLKRDD